MLEGESGNTNLGAVGDDGGSLDQEQIASNVKPDVMKDIQRDTPPQRERWSNRREFLLSCIAMSVGVGNVWRFPFVAYDNGGGAFLVPYLIVLVVICKPLHYMEFILGQFSSYGNVKIWEISPGFRGVGYGQALANWAVVTFYLSLMGLCVYFFFGSFSSLLPWSVCGSWASENCVGVDSRMNFSNTTNMPVIASEEYFKLEVLKMDPHGFDNGLGLPDLRLALCLLLSWTVVFCVQVKGVRSSGKAAYFTALFPYVVLLIMFIRGVTLPGAWKGIMYFITPQWGKLLEPKVWFAAVEQCFFSLSLGFGPVIMFASYNPFRQDIYWDSTFITFLDSFTCVFAGCTIFAILGHQSELLGVEIQEVVRGGGTPLAFISYPDVLARFDYAPQFFSAIFFLMLFTLGAGSATGMNQATVTIVCDAFPRVKQWKVTLVVSLIGFFVGLLYATPQGQHIVTLVNYYGGGMPIMLLMSLETVAVMWVYGIRSFLKDIEFMINRKMGFYWKFCWAVFNPLFLAIVFVYHQLISERLTFDNKAFGDVPTYAGVSFAALCCLMVPVFFFVALLQRWDRNTSTWDNVRKVFKATPEWCPKDLILREQYRQFKLSDTALPPMPPVT